MLCEKVRAARIQIEGTVVTKATALRPRTKAQPEPGISSIAVEGYKSLRGRSEIAIRPLSLLAGANSSGKSSVMQAPLLLKQTLEAPYDPGALLLDGPHVRFTSADQLLSRRGGKSFTNVFSLSVETSEDERVAVRFERQPGKTLDVVEMSAARPGAPLVTIRRGMSEKEALEALPPRDQKMAARFARTAGEAYRLGVSRERCFLRIGTFSASTGEYEGVGWADPLHQVHRHLRAIIHVPALRGNPERTYKTTAVGTEFPGTFEPYVASIVSQWQTAKDLRLERLGDSLEKLGLTWKVEAARVDDTQVELRVGRLRRSARGGARDLVSIADVGFGLSQSLPVVVALLTAQPGQLVYLEEPEIHLHPRAQAALARILADAANRGVRVVVETHSALLLLAVQTLVAEGSISPDLVALHWFSLSGDGSTELRSADLDRAGAFGDWPEDFDEVTLEAQSRYLDAAEAQLVKP